MTRAATAAAATTRAATACGRATVLAVQADGGQGVLRHATPGLRGHRARPQLRAGPNSVRAQVRTLRSVTVHADRAAVAVASAMPRTRAALGYGGVRRLGCVVTHPLDGIGVVASQGVGEVD